MNLPAPYRAVGRFVVIALCCAALVGIFRVLRFEPNPPAEVLRSSLVLLDGRLCLRGQTNPFTGIMVEAGESGVLLSRSAVSNGLLEGLCEGFHTNGQRQVAEYFRAGVSDGLRTKWHPNGRKLSQATIVGGKLHGTFRRWFEDGALAEEIEMNQGNPHGLSRSFYPSGFLKAEARMQAGKMLDQKFWKDGEYRPAGSGA
jgi:antitoxin component YwqK of YwqJK toxin-antitoxin module